MAVQQNRKTPSKRGMRRAHDSLKASTLSVEPTTGETSRLIYCLFSMHRAGRSSQQRVWRRRRSWRPCLVR